MRIDILTLFPEACEPFLSASILGRARQAGHVTIVCHNIRDYSTDPHKKVDDRPFGGGPGMVMMCQPIFDAVETVEKIDSTPARRLLLCPQGRKLDQRFVEDLARSPRLMLIAGHYEGFDDRVRDGLAVEEVSIGDYVLSGGEAAAMVIADAVVRLMPGALGHDESAVEESFSVPASARDAGEQAVCLEYPQYTRPREFRGMAVPDILLSGDHARIRAWRAEQAMKRTQDRRPDLLGGS
ncbi:MAG: tRNA (guanosine(37)-N1)-methyltransferase TrmD [Planctomycetes bacterium]|nr:tRNA (guanosine(37)-N1)-methyltransferase TrmD [Planctomycetota bacterium]